MPKKIELRSLLLPELAALLAELGQPKFRARQLYSWLHQKQIRDFSEMTDLPKALLQTLSERGTLTELTLCKKLVSRLDGTVKYLFELPDGECVETVRMRYRHALSACISTQVGCRMGCAFCASAKAGFVRNLTPAEMLGQVYAAQRDAGERIGSLVLMGIGEPLDNFDNVLHFLDILRDEAGNSLSLRHVSLSTCGLVDRIDELARHRLGLTLSVSLHAPNDAIRSRTMPISQKWPMDELLAACFRYAKATGRRVSFEYALIEGVNDSEEAASELATRLRAGGESAGWCHINLIPVNEIRETDFHRAKRERVEAFQARLLAKGINTTIRRTLGADIEAACGQLRRDSQHEGKEGLH